MNRSSNSSKPQKPAGRAPKWYAYALAGLICLSLLIMLLFARSYGALRAAILQERVDYVEEISAQIMANQLVMEREYSETILNLARILENESVSDIGEVHKYISSKEKPEILLMSSNSNMVDLNGKHISMPNNLLLQRLLSEKGVIRLFTTLNYEEDSWLFAVPISPKEIGGAVYQAVILSVSTDEFRGNMTISLLDDRGASYIVGNDGRIKIQPRSDSLAFGGYNLFNSMLSQGAPREDIDKILLALAQGEVGSALIPCGGHDWLLGHTPIDGETSIVVTIPLTLTAARTYKGLSDTIALSALSIIAVALIAILLILRFFRRDREREKKALAVAAKSDFYAKMSHDIRTPLGAVMGLMTLAKENAHDPEAVKDYIEQSSSSANYLLGILNDVLDMSRIESGKLTLSENPFDMNALIEDVKAVARPLLADKKLEFIDEANERFDVEYMGDAVRVKQILMNLLSNAAKFTRPGGHVGLKITRDSNPDDRDWVTMVVWDTGIGMSQEFLSHIFAPFEQESSSYSQQYAGSGLGLSIAHDLTRMMGGTIDVLSQLGEGSTFTVRLPFTRGREIEREQSAKNDEAATFEGRRVLLAEDNEINQMVAVKLISTLFRIDTDAAPDGAIALKMFADSAPGTYDMILMDIRMPNMDGLESTRAIRALPRPDARTIPIIAFSANTYKEDVALSLSAGMDGHLSKPLDTQALKGVFQRFFGERS